MRGAGKDLECRAGNGALQSLAEADGIKRVVGAPDNRRGYTDLGESRRPFTGVAMTEGAQVARQCIASRTCGEVPEAGVECEVASLGVHEAASDTAMHQAREQVRWRVAGQGAERARHPRHPARADAERGTTHEDEGRDALRPAHGERLRDTAA